MARTSLSTTERRKATHNARRKAKLRQSVVAVAALGSILAASQHRGFRLGVTSNSTPRPLHTSILTGIGWVTELQYGHPDRFRRQMGMSKILFRKLLRDLQVSTGLQDSKYIKAEEQAAIFLHFCVTGATNRQLQERFQHSGDTISR